jgi:uncharacterized protein
MVTVAASSRRSSEPLMHGPHFRNVILKLTSFCNLNCSYCYMFNQADRSFERMPPYMSAETAVTALRRLAAHARVHEAATIGVVLHGGEPTLWPIENFRQLFQAIREIRDSEVGIEVSLQTNGFLIQHQLAELLVDNDVTLGVSLDGPEKYNDTFRITHSGAGSYARISRNIEQLLDWGFDRRRFGVLCVINPGIPPSAFLRWADELPLDHLSVLWPIEFSWSKPPWGITDQAAYARHPVYGQWMAAAFEQWWESFVDRLYVQSFIDTIARMMGSHHHSDSIGNDSVDMFVVNCDGSIEYSDYLRAQIDGGASSGYRVQNTDLDELRNDKVFRTLLTLREHLPDFCSGCPHVDVCGGGFLPGRSDSSGFCVTRRSVLCYDQAFYFDTVRRIVSPYIQVIRSAVEPSLGRPI